MKEKIIELFLSDNGLALRYFVVSSRLGTELEKTRDELNKLADEGILYRQSGYYQLNPPHLWKDEETKQKYGDVAEEGIISSARDFLSSFERLARENK